MEVEQYYEEEDLELKEIERLMKAEERERNLEVRENREQNRNANLRGREPVLLKYGTVNFYPVMGQEPLVGVVTIYGEIAVKLSVYDNCLRLYGAFPGTTKADVDASREDFAKAINHAHFLIDTAEDGVGDEVAVMEEVAVVKEVKDMTTEEFNAKVRELAAGAVEENGRGVSNNRNEKLKELKRVALEMAIIKMGDNVQHISLAKTLSYAKVQAPEWLVKQKAYRK